MKLSTLLLGALLIGSNAWWVYRTVDQGVTNTYREQERYEVANRVVALSALAAEVVTGKTKSEAEAMLKKLFPDQEPFEKDGALRTPWIALQLSKEARITGLVLDEGTKDLAKSMQPPSAKP